MTPAPDLPVATLWERLVSVALVGTERKPAPADALAQVAALLGPPDSPAVPAGGPPASANALAGSTADDVRTPDHAGSVGNAGADAGRSEADTTDTSDDDDSDQAEGTSRGRPDTPERGNAGANVDRNEADTTDTTDDDDSDQAEGTSRGRADTPEGGKAGAEVGRSEADTAPATEGDGSGWAEGTGQGRAEAAEGDGSGDAEATGRGRGGWASEELAVVMAAGVVAAYRRVGLVVEHSDRALPDAAAVDERSEASATASQLLALLLEGHVRVLGGPTELIEDWLVRCSSGGHRPPARLLPALLDHATRILALRPAVAAAGGPRAAWLAERNPLWSWAAAGQAGQAGQAGGRDDRSDDEVWRTGEPGARLAVVAARRATDPAGARHLVEETWSGEKAKDRAQILEVLGTGLSLDDEAFLEDRLDDRAPTVRATAADLLATLPGSQLAQRMTDRVRPLVTHRRKNRKKLEIALPDPPDAAARRDGIVDTGAPPATGRRTWWLIQLIGATPLAFWTGELGLSPADAVKQAQQHELVEGWVLAASRSSDASWGRQLLRVAPDPRLLRALPDEQARDLLPIALERATDPAVAGLLVATPAAWPELLSRWVVHRLRANRNAVSLDRSLTRLASAGDAAIIPDLERWIDELRLHDRLRTTLRDVAHTLSIRRTIAQELS